MKIACATYSYVSAPLYYPGSAGSPAQDDAVAEAPILAFVERLADHLGGGLLDGVEFWFAHTPAWALTPLLAAQVRQRLRERELTCAACGGSVGNPGADPDGAEAWFQVASMLHAPLIAGDVVPSAVDELAQLCARHRIRVAYENHPETEVDEILDRIKGGNEWIGVTLDTGSLAQHGGDPVKAVRQLGKSLMHVHVRDVPSVASEQSVPIGSGIVDVPGVMQELMRVGYPGWVSIEIPLEAADPSPAIIDAARMIRQLFDQ